MDNSEEKCAQVRPLLKAGQVWIDRSGDKVTIDNRYRYPYSGDAAGNSTRMYNENGWRVNEDDSGPSYLVRLCVDDEKQPDLDLSNPVRLKKDHSIQGRITYGPTKRGVLLIELTGDDIVGNVEDWENIPEPKRTATRELTATMEGEGLMIRPSAALNYIGEISHAEVSYTEDEGWSIEEIKS